MRHSASMSVIDEPSRSVALECAISGGNLQMWLYWLLVVHQSTLKIAGPGPKILVDTSLITL